MIRVIATIGTLVRDRVETYGAAVVTRVIIETGAKLAARTLKGGIRLIKRSFATPVGNPL